jgi:Zn-dependent protease with chaperone function/competence protein ComGC
METTLPCAPAGLVPHHLNAPKERTYFRWVLLISVLAWIGLAISIVGLFYAAVLGFFFWLGHGLLVAYLRAEAVRVSERQMPELATTFRSVCEQLGIKHPPALYVLQSGGLLNAFATRHTGRDFVVVYSDLLEAIGPSSPEMRFLLGHEIGHLKSGHILKQVLLAPGLFFPLIGPAYRRAWETSCDRYGALAAGDVNAAARGLLLLAGGRQHGPQLDVAAYTAQYTDERGFFVSLHELTSTYPTLSRRVLDVLALAQGATPPRAPRHFLAYLLGALMPGGGAGSASPAGALVVIMMCGLIAAMSIPAFQKVRQASEQKVCFNNQRMMAAAFEQFQLENGAPAQKWTDVVGEGKIVATMPVCPRQGEYNASHGEDTGYTIECSVHGDHRHPPPTQP